MDQYVTGSTIKKLREQRGLTQLELAYLLVVSDKTISKWETGKGYPDITLLEGLAKSLNVSVTELLLGNPIKNTNISSNMLKTGFYVCPLCNNIIQSTGEAFVSCHGITLPKLEPEESIHEVKISLVEDEYFVEINHPMRKDNYISFIASVSSDKINLIKLYPESNAETRVKASGVKYIYYYSNKEGLFRLKIN
ncbi:MAG: helix-turn-helix domain-containing protein [Acholeplasmataceae bacterium]|jgi:transcriptional regulator with XRE-family HTH domain|nr:helix-turn-helix domain-containing protein [Acholeplasmataceae bacterium]